MLATIHDDSWNVLNMQHTVTPNSKRWDYLDIPDCGNERFLKDRPTLHRLISAAVGRLDDTWPRRITHCPWTEKSCALAPLNKIPMLPKEKYQFPSDLSSKTSTSTFMCVMYMIIRRYQVFFENFVCEKMAYVTNRLQKVERWQRLLLAWRLGPAHIAEGGHHLRNAPSLDPRSGWGLSPKFFWRRVYLIY